MKLLLAIKVNDLLYHARIDIIKPTCKYNIEDKNMFFLGDEESIKVLKGMVDVLNTHIKHLEKRA